MHPANFASGPALRERGGDVALLAWEFLRRFNQQHNARFSFAPSALEHIARQAFPGNIRELENYVLRAATLATSDLISLSDLVANGDGSNFGNQTAAEPASRAVCIGGPGRVREVDAEVEQPLGAARHLVSRADLLKAMEWSGWVKAKAARLLKLTPRQVGYALEKYDIPLRKL